MNKEDNIIFLYKTVSDYTNMGYSDVRGLPCDEFMRLYKNAVIEKLLETEEGRKVLEDTIRFTQKECDAEGLERLCGK